MSLGDEITSLTSPRGVVSPGRLHSGNTSKHVLSGRCERRRGPGWLYELCVGRCEGGRHIKKKKKKRLDAGIKGKKQARVPLMRGGEEGPGGSACSGEEATALHGPLRFLSITYQWGQSAAEIKQFPQCGRPLNTAGGRSSLRSLILLKLRGRINPG